MHPVLFNLPFFDIPMHAYGVMLGLALVAGFYLTGHLATGDGIDRVFVRRAYVWTAISALLGARLLFWVANPQLLADAGLLDIFVSGQGGLVAYGGFLGGFVGAAIYSQVRRESLLRFADCAAPALGLGLALARVGCLLQGCDYGKPIPTSASKWLNDVSVRFPNWELLFPEAAEDIWRNSGVRGAAAFWHHVHSGLVAPSDTFSLAVYPTQLLSVVNGLLALALTMVARRYATFRGQTFLVFVIYYGISRAAIELLRGDTQRGGLGDWSTSQIIGLTTALVAASAWIVLKLRAKRSSKNDDRVKAA